MNPVIIKNGTVFQEDKTFAKKNLYIENGRIAEFLPETSDVSEIDADGLYVLPGLVDIHSHGAVGQDFSDNNMDGLHKILQYEYSHGITSYCPTSMTLKKDEICKIYCKMENWEDQEGMSHAAAFGIPWEEAIAAASMVPAKSIGIFDETGSLTPGKRADVILVDKELKLVRVL